MTEISNTNMKMQESIFLKAREISMVIGENLEIESDSILSRLKKTNFAMDDRIVGCVSSGDKYKNFEITLSSGLMILLHNFAKILAHMFVRANPTPVSLHDRPRYLMARESFFDLMDSLIEERPTDTSIIKLAEFDRDQAFLHAQLLHHLERFVVAHEYGHVLVNTTECFSDLLEETFSLLSDPIGNLTPLGRREQDVFVLPERIKESWAEEFVCDEIGAIICVAGGLPVGEVSMRWMRYS